MINKIQLEWPGLSLEKNCPARVGGASLGSQELGRLRQDGCCEFEVSTAYVARLKCHQRSKKERVLIKMMRSDARTD